MKEILIALENAILAGMPEMKAGYILTDEISFPAAARFPCFGLKDGDQSFSEGMAQTESEKGFVMIYVAVQILKDEASILGDGSNKGVLDLAKDLRSLLNWNTLGGIVHHAYCPDSPGSEIMEKDGNVFVQRKGIRFNYER